MSPAEQRSAALEHANQIRSMRAAVKAGLKDRPQDIAYWIREPLAVLEGMRVSELVRALPGYGVPKTERLLRRCGVPWEKRVGSLTHRQVDALVEALA